jgi:hypothetical protein
MNRVLLVYKALGRVLNNPQSFGLGERPPKPLTEALSAMRQNLGEELAEENDPSSEDWLSRDLSQDADQSRPVKIASVATKT